MTIKRLELGRCGEREATSFLERSGYKILEQNFRSKTGEIDIIATDKDTICFVEVRTKTADWHGHPFESISSHKVRRLTKTALCYLQKNDLSEAHMRFDVVAVLTDKEAHLHFELLKDAFEAAFV